MNKTKNYDLAVFIGRFQPVHNAHIEIIRRASRHAKNILVLIGSANQPRTFKDPFTAAERSLMLFEACATAGITHSPGETSSGGTTLVQNDTKLFIEPIQNSLYDNNAWAVRVQSAVARTLQKLNIDGGNVALFGHFKDESSYYLKMFPQWDFIEYENTEQLSATEIRSLYFHHASNLNFIAGVVPRSTLGQLQVFKQSESFDRIVAERVFIEDYKKQYEQLPYPPIFVTTDAVVVQAGNVLMVRRRAEPGKGLWAFPGGFVDAASDLSLEDAMIRELIEETGIKLPEKVLRGSIKKRHVFDAIGRSARGRTITHGFYIGLSEGEWNLPKLKAGSDAASAEWVPIADLKSEECFEDHYDILQYFLNTGK